MAETAERRRILLAEDDADDRALMHRMLRGQRRAYEVVDAHTGAEVLEKVRSGEQFDCLLLDYHLPDMDGIDVIKAMREEHGLVPVPVSILTGRDDDSVAMKAIVLGAEDYVLKTGLTPLTLSRSIENVREKFEHRRQLETQRAALDMRNRRLEAMAGELGARLEELSAATQARDRFIAMMSHEMRTPLNAILGYAELLELEIEGKLTEGQRKNLERIRVGSRHLLDLINDVLDLARADAKKLDLDLRPVDLAAAIEESVTLLENQATRKGLKLTAELTRGVPKAVVDLQRLRQILTNIVGNAIKFTESGGIIVSAHEAENAMVAITIRDTGIGMSAEVARDVFNEFYQAETGLTRTYGGSGLGLAIARRLARAMGGDIDVVSEPLQGSTFRILLPTAMSAAGADLDLSEPPSAAVPEQRTRRKAVDAPGDAIVVVAFADDAAALAALEKQVRPAVRIVWTTDADKVPDLVAGEKASLVILDISSAAGAAWKIGHAVTEREGSNPPPILLLPQLAAISVSDEGAAVNLGLVALVPKPFTSEQLTRAVSTAAGQDIGMDEPALEVLLVDDDEDSRRVATRILTRNGVTVRECVDGETGLVEMRRRRPDVVVLDLMMPVLDGFGVLATMRADPLLVSVPVVVLTAKTLTEPERQFLSRTAVRVLQKGEHRLADIAALVQRAAQRARQHRSSPENVLS